MTSVAESVHRRGGIAATHQLYEDGHTRDSIRRAVHRGEVRRVRQGWYAIRNLPEAVVEAARVGGTLTCLSSLKLQGFWVVHDTDLHVAVLPNACRLRTRDDSHRRLADAKAPRTRVHWRSDSPPGSQLLLPPLASLSDMLACKDAETVAATADSVLHSHPQFAAGWREMVAAAPEEKRPLLGLVDGVCESGTETIFWLRTRLLHVAIRRQVEIRGAGRVDFLLGSKLIVEVDGAEYHTDPARFEADRRRDAILSRMGYRVLRFSYRQVMHNWAEVEAAVIGALLRGDHL
jgi:very-short-patch-repair endonuclease